MGSLTIAKAGDVLYTRAIGGESGEASDDILKYTEHEHARRQDNGRKHGKR